MWRMILMVLALEPSTSAFVLYLTWLRSQIE